jgi:hypothetical protein
MTLGITFIMPADYVIWSKLTALWSPAVDLNIM